MKLTPQETIWIIGASSGIGKAVAEYALAQGAHVIASARNRDNLEKIHNQSGSLTILPLDLTNLQATQNAVSQIKAMGIPNRILVFTGTYTPAAVKNWQWNDVESTLTTNLTSLLHLVHQLAQQSCLPQQLALTASVAGYVGLPNGQPYSATKAALINFCQSLRTEWQPLGTDVKVINPGFVKTPLTDKNPFAMPFLLTPQQAAQATWRGLQGRGFEVTYPKRLSWGLKLLAAMPYSIYGLLTRRMLSNKA